MTLVTDLSESAEEYPIRGLFRVSSFWNEIHSYYNLHMGDENGVNTGWPELDEYYRVCSLLLLSGLHLARP